MTKWEYRIFSVDLDQSTGISHAIEYANDMGSMGWELVSVTVVPDSALTSPNTGTLMFTLKRPQAQEELSD